MQESALCIVAVAILLPLAASGGRGQTPVEQSPRNCQTSHP